MVAKDLSEQPPSSFVLIVGSQATNYYSVQSFSQDGDTMRFYDADDFLVYCCRVDAQWALVARSAVGLVTEADLIKFTKDDHKAEADFMRELDPETFKKVEDMMAQGLIGRDEDGQMVIVRPQAGGGGMPSREPRNPEEEARLKTGQYL